MIVFNFFTLFSVVFVGNVPATARAIIASLGIIANLFTVPVPILALVNVHTGFHILYDEKNEILHF